MCAFHRDQLLAIQGKHLSLPLHQHLTDAPLTTSLAYICSWRRVTVPTCWPSYKVMAARRQATCTLHGRLLSGSWCLFRSNLPGYVTACKNLPWHTTMLTVRRDMVQPAATTVGCKRWHAARPWLAGIHQQPLNQHMGEAGMRGLPLLLQP